MKVGNYIHFNYDGYRNHGLRMKNGSKPATPAAIVEQHKRDLKRIAGQGLDISQTDIERLERQLNFFYGGPGPEKDQGGIKEEDMKLLEEALYQYLSKHVKELQEYDISLEDLSAYRKDGAQSQSGSNRNHLGATKTTAAAIIRRIEFLEKAVANGSAALKNNVEKTLEDFQGKYEKIIEGFQQIEHNLEEKAITKQKTVRERTVINAKYFEGKEVSYDNFIGEINKMLSAVKSSLVNQILGHMGEYVAAIMPQIYRNMATQEVSKIIQDFTSNIDKYIVGGQVSAKVIDENLVYGIKRGSHLSKKGNEIQDIQFGKFGVRQNINYTQDKIDVILEVSDGASVAASVKNISANAENIHILSGSSLLKYLQLYPVFANHYLNVTANIRTGPEAEASNRTCVRAPSAAVQEMHQGMLATLGTHALVGGLKGINTTNSNIYNTGKAQVLVVNIHGGKGKGKFHVIPMTRLLDNIEKNIEVSGGIQHDKPKEWHNIFLSQHTGKSSGQAAAARIINILAEVHAVKLSVSIRKEAVLQQ